MDNLVNRKWLVGGIAAAGVLGVAAWFLSDDGKKATAMNTRKLSKVETIAILKDIRRECASAFITLASFANSIREQTGGKIQDSDLREILMTQSPLLDQIKKGENKVYEKHRVTEQMFKDACKKSYVSDKYIQSLMTEMKDTLEKAFKGAQPEMKSEIPEFITPELTLKILDSMYLSCRKVAFAKMEGLRQKGIRISPEDP